MPTSFKHKIHISTAQAVTLGFAALILLGAFLLMLPIASKERCVTPFHDAVFTATSAVCVTGLVVHDTASYWSVFGQSIILVLIQIGGLGVVMVAVLFFIMSGRKISLMQRNAMQETLAAPRIGGIVRMTGFILRATLVIEAVGAVMLMPRFCSDFGPKGIWMSVFHSISSFCNAGFDIMGTKAHPYQSLTSYAGSFSVNTVIILNIIIGGIGFLTWDDLIRNRWHFKKYRLQTKVILITTFVLIIVPALLFFFNEYASVHIKKRVFLSLFQSVTTRTAGFNTADFSEMSGTGRAVTVFLMLIGGSPGSTAGGVKTTTLTVLVANTVSVLRRQKSTHIFRRRVEESALRSASTLVMLYAVLFASGAAIISLKEGYSLGTCLFETASAIGTVGLSLGITPHLGIFSQVILIMLMFFGRVGILTLFYAAIRTKPELSKAPAEKISVG